MGHGLAVRPDRGPGAAGRAPPGRHRRCVRRRRASRSPPPSSSRSSSTGGPGPALLVHGLGVLLGELAKRKPLWKVVFNTGQYVACLSVAAACSGWPACGPRRTSRSATSRCTRLLVMGLSWVVYFVVNLALVATVTTVYDGTGWWDDFVDDIGYYAVTTFAVLALSPVVVVVTATSWGLIPLLLLPLFLVYKTASISLEKEHAALHDALTGLANRKHLVTQMALAGEESARTGRAGGAVPARPRPLQGDQRHPRPPHRRPAARDRRRPAVPRRPTRGHGRPARRRRVRGAADRRRRTRRRRSRRRPGSGTCSPSPTTSTA